MNKMISTAGLGLALVFTAMPFGSTASQTALAGRPMTDPASRLPYGEKVREANVCGYTFRYYLTDLGGASKERTHHLMLYITGPDGQPTVSGKAAFKVIADHKREQTAMVPRGNYVRTPVFRPLEEEGIPMESGYGADVNFRKGGSYTISSRFHANGRTLMDEFAYTQG